MLDAFGLGALPQSSLLPARVIVVWITVPTRIIGILAGFGAGAMISAIASDLVPEAEHDPSRRRREADRRHGRSLPDLRGAWLLRARACARPGSRQLEDSPSYEQDADHQRYPGNDPPRVRVDPSLKSLNRAHRLIGGQGK